MKSRSIPSILAVVLVLSFAVHILHAEGSSTDKQWKKFKGAWFEVLYPEGFTVEPSLKSSTSVAGFDSAFFVSPAKDVAYYVFSPQWNGKPTDIFLKDNVEKQVSQKKSEKDGVVTIECTIAAKDGSYTRSYVDVEDTNTNTRQVFGIKYRDQKVFDANKDRYTQFKNSLVQFAD